MNTTKPKNHYYYGLGRRKTASARVRLLPGTGKLLINTKVIQAVPVIVKQPIELVGQWGKFDISAKTVGGGKNGQLQAIRLGIARALLQLNPDYRKTLKLEGMLTRDPRAKERKKPGLKKARKAPQWSKR